MTTATNPRHVALITGASSGIGLACAEHLAQRGYRVYGASRSVPPSTDDRVIHLPVNVDDDESVTDGVSQIIQAEQRIDVVINSAGFGLAGAIEDTSIEEAKAQFDTNFFGVMRVCRNVLPQMRQQRSGIIINISSLAGLTGIPYQGLYCASKYALEGLSESLRMEVAPFGIRVVLVEPGDFATGLTAKRRRTLISQSNPAYQEQCEKAISKMEQDELNGPSPQLIAPLIERIIQTPNPQLRYTCGMFSQRFGVGLKRFLPYSLYEKLYKQSYGLQ